MSEWKPLAGADRERIPATHLAWIVGWTEHSDAIWRREGMAILSLNNTGPFGYCDKTIQHAMRQLDMQAIKAVTHYLAKPSGPEAAEVATEEDKR